MTIELRSAVTGVSAGRVDVGRIKILITAANADSVAAVDSMVEPGTKTFAVDLEVPAEGLSGDNGLYAAIELFTPDDSLVYRNDPSPQRLVLGRDTIAAEIVLSYVGPGSEAIEVVITSNPPTVTFGEMTTLAAEARGLDGVVVANTPIVWEILDPLVSFVGSPESRLATLLAGDVAGVASVVAHTPHGYRDTVMVAVIDNTPNLEVVGGSNVGALGSGTVTSTPAGIDCAITDGVAALNGCAAIMPVNAWNVLAAAPGPGSTFRGWRSLSISPIQCDGAGECRLGVGTSLRAVAADFDVLAPNAPLLVAGEYLVIAVNDCTNELGIGSSFQFRTDYTDQDGDVVVGTAIVDLAWQFLFDEGFGPGNGDPEAPAPNGWFLVAGDAGSGTLSTRTLCFTYESTSRFDMTVILSDAAGNRSNSLVIQVPKPAGAN